MYFIDFVSNLIVSIIVSVICIESVLNTSISLVTILGLLHINKNNIIMVNPIIINVFKSFTQQN